MSCIQGFNYQSIRFGAMTRVVKVSFPDAPHLNVQISHSNVQVLCRSIRTLTTLFARMFKPENDQPNESILTDMQIVLEALHGSKKDQSIKEANETMGALSGMLRVAFPKGVISHSLVGEAYNAPPPEIFTKIYYDMLMKNIAMVPLKGCEMQLPDSRHRFGSQDASIEGCLEHYAKCRNMLDDFMEKERLTTDPPQLPKELIQAWKQPVKYWGSQIPEFSPGSGQRYNFFGTKIQKNRRKLFASLVQPLLTLGSVCKGFRAFIFSSDCEIIWRELHLFMLGHGNFSPLLFTDLPTELMTEVYADQMTAPTLDKAQSAGTRGPYKTIRQHVDKREKAKKLSFAQVKGQVLSYLFLEDFPSDRKTNIDEYTTKRLELLKGLSTTLLDDDYSSLGSKKKWQHDDTYIKIVSKEEAKGKGRRGIKRRAVVEGPPSKKRRVHFFSLSYQ